MDKLPFAHLGRAGMRAAKNYTKGYSEIQTKVREATSNDPWGPSGSQMNIIAQATFNQQDFIEIMETLDKRLNDKGKNWRHVFKSLTLLDYILHAGSENVVLYFQENIYIVKTLREFVFVDEEGKDQGSNVRQKAKDITNLLLDDARIRRQRRSRSDMRDRMSGRNGREDSPDSEDEERRRAAFRRAKSDDNRNFVKSGEDDELARALEESRRMAGMESERANKNRRANDDLEEALRLSREEEERRKRMLEGNNSSLFDPDAPQNRNEFGWDSLVDNNPQPQQQMPMITGFAQFNPYAQQQQEEYMRQQQQEEYMRQQQQLAEMQRQMEYQQQQMAQAQAEQDAYNAMMAQQAYLQQQQQYQAMQAQMAQQQQQPLVPQHTSVGSNNPFAAFSQPSEPVPPVPEIPQASQPANMPKPILKQPKDDGKHAHLAGLLANRDDGIDTFGNAGALRYGRLGPQQTGTNPFQRQQQQQQQQKQAEQPFFEL